jgi:hypothetical protein
MQLQTRMMRNNARFLWRWQPVAVQRFKKGRFPSLLKLGEQAKGGGPHSGSACRSAMQRQELIVQKEPYGPVNPAAEVEIFRTVAYKIFWLANPGRRKY